MATGREVLLEILRSEGVHHVFGNPGSTELPFMDALAEADDIQYVLGLQEATVVGMADGYAQATGRPSVVNLHTSAGVGNAIGNLTNAWANGTPMVVTAGQQDYRHIVSDPLLSGDLVGLARSTVKWAHEVRTADELGTVLRRAFNDAMTPPSGPVFVSIPMQMLDEEVADHAPAPSTVTRRSIGSSLDELASLLIEAAPDDLAILAGDAIAHSGALDALVAVAEALGAKVFTNPLTGFVVFPSSHPLNAGGLPPISAGMAQVLAPFRRVFAIGNQVLRSYPYAPGKPIASGCELLHLSADGHQLGRSWPVRLGVVGDPRATLEALLPLVRAGADAQRADEAVRGAASARVAAHNQLESAALARYPDVPMHPSALGHALYSNLPAGVPVVDESITTGALTRPFLRAERSGDWYFCQGGGLGWGMPAAVGISLARGKEPVVCLVGDGSAMYSPQALWTAAHLNLPVVFAIANNRQYLILKNFLMRMGGASAKSGRMIGMDIIDPPVDYVALGRSMGVDGALVEMAKDVPAALEAALAARRPYLLEIPIATP